MAELAVLNPKNWPSRRLSLVELAADELEKVILEGYVAPDDKITEGELAKALSISRPTAQAAIVIMTHRKILEKLANHSATVAKVGQAALQEIVLTRRIVEDPALEQLITNGAFTKVEQPKLISLHAELAQMATQQTIERIIIDHEISFHRELVNASGNPYSDLLYDTYAHEMHLGFVTLGKQFDPEAMLEQHTGILAATWRGLASGNPEPAISALNDHLAYVAAT